MADDGTAVGTLVRVDGDRARVLLDPERSKSADPTGEPGSRTTVTIDRRGVAESTNDRVRLAEGADPTDARSRA